MRAHDMRIIGTGQIQQKTTTDRQTTHQLITNPASHFTLSSKMIILLLYLIKNNAMKKDAEAEVHSHTF